jgi:hypothetical protein
VTFARKFEVTVIVILAARIETRVTIWTLGRALEVLTDGQFGPARSAKDGFLIPLLLGPNLDRVSRQHHMAVFAGVIKTTTLHFDRHDVRRPVVVIATGLGIDIDPKDA